MDNTRVLITRDYIFKHCTEKGGWTKVQLKALGLNYPQHSGWIVDLEGTFITQEQANLFEEGKTEFSTIVPYSKQLRLKQIIKSARKLSKDHLFNLKSTVDTLCKNAKE